MSRSRRGQGLLKEASEYERVFRLRERVPGGLAIGHGSALDGRRVFALPVGHLRDEADELGIGAVGPRLEQRHEHTIVIADCGAARSTTRR